MRVKKNPYVMEWEETRVDEMRHLLAQGKVPYTVDEGKLATMSAKEKLALTPLLMGQVAGAVQELKTAAQVVHEMVSGAAAIFRANAALISKL